MAATALPGAVLSIDRTAFRPQDHPTQQCTAEACYIKSYEIGELFGGFNPRYHFWDQGNYREGGSLRTPFIDGFEHFVRACLMYGGYDECGNDWYADLDR